MDATSKTCSFCAEVIPAVAVRCPYCRSELATEKEPASPAIATSDQVGLMGASSAEPTPTIATAATTGAPERRIHAALRRVPEAVTAPKNESDETVGDKAKTAAPFLPATAADATVPAARAAGTAARFGMRSVVGLLVVAGAVGMLATLAFMQSARKKAASIELSGLPGAIMEGGAVKVSAVVRNGNGALIEDARVAFAVEPANIAAIDPQGALTCSERGDFDVIATAGDVHKRASSRCMPAAAEAPIEPAARHRAHARVVGAEGQSVRTNAQPDIAAPGAIAPDPSGQQATPWVVRADRVLTDMLRGASGPVVARSIQGITHPTGGHASLAGFEIRHVGTGLSVRLSVRWAGGLGFEQTTVVVWSFDQRRHREATVLSDSSPIPIATANAGQLDSYFRNEMFPVVLNNIGN